MGSFDDYTDKNHEVMGTDEDDDDFDFGRDDDQDKNKSNEMGVEIKVKEKDQKKENDLNELKNSLLARQGGDGSLNPKNRNSIGRNNPDPSMVKSNPFDK